VVTGVSAGTAIITYTAYSGCITTRVQTVDAAPAAGTITGASTFALPASVITPEPYANLVTGGVWSVNPSTVATIDATGNVTGVSPGVATVSYTVSNSCGAALATKVISITASRSAGTTSVAGAPGLAGPSLVVYPNPSSGAFNLRADVAGTLTVYSLEGKELATFKVAEGITTLTLPQHIAAGIYMCRYNGNDGSVIMVRLVYE